MFDRLKKAVRVLAVLVACGLPAAAQVTLGQNAELRSGGSLSFGYSGSSGNYNVSSDSLSLGGRGWLRGFYYRPQFLSFDFQPYYLRSQNDSIYQTITQGSGFTASSNIFGGSRFPGYISFSKTYNGIGQFGIPGLTGITSHGNGRNLAIGWSALLTRLPSLAASYSTTSGESTVFGADTNSSASSRNFTLRSAYTLAGFSLMGQYINLSTVSNFPSILESGAIQESSTGSNSFVANVGHKLPLAGSWSLAWNRSKYAGEYWSGGSGGSNTGVVNNLNTLASLNPTRKLGVAFGANYNDNAFGALQQKVLEAGGAPLPTATSNLRTLSVNGMANYSLFSNLAVYGRANHYERWVYGERLGMTQFSGNATYNYTRSLLGSMTFSLGVIDTFTQQGNSAASLFGNVNFLRRVHAWEFGADFGYSQEVQTLYDVYTTSSYRYGANAKRRFRSLRWIGSFRGSQSGLSQFAGYKSRSEAFSNTIIVGRYTLTGHYTQSEGTSILTSSGLIEVPSGVPPPLLHSLILYNARSLGGGVGFSPFRRAVVSVSYNQARSATAGPALSTGFYSTIFNSRFQYRLRKMDLDANFTRFEQSIRTGGLPAVVNAYYIRFSRWFNIF